jgi:hypothetical protein
MPFTERFREFESVAGAPRVRRRIATVVLALRAAGARLPKRWPTASAVRQRQEEARSSA